MPRSICTEIKITFPSLQYRTSWLLNPAFLRNSSKLNFHQMATATKASKNIYRLFVGNLPWTVSHQELKVYFRDFGRVINANVVFDKKSGLSKGYGFVTLSGLKSVEQIENVQKHVLEGNFLNIQKS